MCVWLQFYVHVHEILDCFWVQYIFRHKFIVVKSAFYLLSICISVAPTAWISVKFYVGGLLQKSVRENPNLLTMGQKYWTLTWGRKYVVLLLATSNCHKSTLLTKTVPGCSFSCLSAYIIVAPTGQIYFKFRYWGLI